MHIILMKDAPQIREWRARQNLENNASLFSYPEEAFLSPFGHANKKQADVAKRFAFDE